MPLLAAVGDNNLVFWVGVSGIVATIAGVILQWRKGRTETGDSVVARFEKLATASDRKIDQQTAEIAELRAEVRTLDSHVAALEQENEECVKGRNKMEAANERLHRRVEHLERLLENYEPGGGAPV